MLYDYLKRAYKNSDPIFLAEIDGYSKEYVRQEMNRLTRVCQVNFNILNNPTTPYIFYI